ncbi:sigma E protease regulator RseP [Alteromonas aestuariivivens]|uniref:Zinc metalloprotease n=1 Tax=Alteromonas aestuariivivens TaxID=1938339 RepID=A0A3D8M4D2_9ALTE|nr:sigma E protease regulator RseP [Alteromonas aestuariivivens]RDV24405.1 sigma E protease regulator RseP [Alteromonas aestuariivivens]
MVSVIWSIGAFIVALGILVAVHEWGHFYVARRCGVQVERFSIGFGKPLWRRTDQQGTEFVIAAIPLGGYVRMLDERIDDVPEGLQHKAFNRQTVGKRMAIIAAGPGVNFLFAAVALFVMYLIGITTVKPVVGDIIPGSIVAQSGLAHGDQIQSIGSRETSDWEAVNFELMSHIGSASIELSVVHPSGEMQKFTLDTREWAFDPDKQSALRSLGISPYRPEPTMMVGMVEKGAPADIAGLQVGDKILALDSQVITDWMSLVEYIVDKPGQAVQLTIDRNGRQQVINATIARRDTPQGQNGFLGVSPEFEPWPEGYVFTHQYGPIEAFSKALSKTWRLMTLSVEMLGKLVTGDVSVKSLSGPISIAQGAGISAGYGLVYFLGFLALISVNLGIINLLPLPMLDGGHLMYFTVEWLTGKPVPEAVQEWGFRIGGALLLMIMSIAIFNDISRLA